MEQWKPSCFHFEMQEACESLRSELVRRESNPRRREAATAHMAEMDRKYRQNTPLHVRVFDYLFCGSGYLWLYGREPRQPLDFFGQCKSQDIGVPAFECFIVVDEKIHRADAGDLEGLR